MEKVKKRDICAALLGATIATILWITILGRKETVENVIIFRPFHSMHSIITGIKRQGIRSNFLGNILMFIPVGILFPVVMPWGRKWYCTTLIGFSISLIIEIIQLITAKGYFEIDDMLLNTFGTIVGFILLFAVTQKGDIRTELR